MRCMVRLLRLLSAAALPVAILAAGCGGRGDLIIMQQPIAVSLPISTVVVPQDGLRVIVPINITSTGETALVGVSGLPTGVQVEIFSIGYKPFRITCVHCQRRGTQGTYVPMGTVNSAGATASSSFILVITEASQTGSIPGQEKSATPRKAGRSRRAGGSHFSED